MSVGSMYLVLGITMFSLGGVWMIETAIHKKLKKLKKQRSFIQRRWRSLLCIFFCIIQASLIVFLESIVLK
jgi:CBS domain containing-hemolysin-like protein